MGSIMMITIGSMTGRLSPGYTLPRPDRDGTYYDMYDHCHHDGGEAPDGDQRMAKRWSCTVAVRDGTTFTIYASQNTGAVVAAYKRYQ